MGAFGLWLVKVGILFLTAVSFARECLGTLIQAQFLASVKEPENYADRLYVLSFSQTQTLAVACLLTGLALLLGSALTQRSGRRVDAATQP